VLLQPSVIELFEDLLQLAFNERTRRRPHRFVAADDLLAI
jgi:hypothetical protein